MKSIAKALVVATLMSTAAVATAAERSYPSGEYSQTQVFPNIATWESQHRASELTQPSVAYPSAAEEEYPLANEFPGMTTYENTHAGDPGYGAAAPTFPSSGD